MFYTFKNLYIIQDIRVKDLFGGDLDQDLNVDDEDILYNFNYNFSISIIMKTEDIMLVLVIVIVIIFLFIVFKNLFIQTPILVEIPNILQRTPFIHRGGPRPCPFPFGCGGKVKPGHGGWFPMSWPMGHHSGGGGGGHN